MYGCAVRLVWKLAAKLVGKRVKKKAIEKLAMPGIRVGKVVAVAREACAVEACKKVG